MKTTFHREFERWSWGLLLAGPLFVAWPCFFGRTYAATDLMLQFQPVKEICRALFLRGEWPLWNPYAALGMPLAGDLQSGAFYPLGLGFYAMPFAHALGLHLLVHFGLIGFGARRLFRALGAAEAAALVGALAVQGNGFVLARLEFVPALAAMAWTPWILAAVAEGAGVAVLALLFALQLYAGYPHALAYGLVPVFALSALWPLPRRRRPAAVAGALGLGLLLAAPLLLPAAELWLRSGRLAGGQPVDARAVLGWRDLRYWVLPWPLETAERGHFWMKAFFPGWSVLGAALAGLALGGRRSPWRAGGLGLLLAGLAAAGPLGAAWLQPAGLALARRPTLALEWCVWGLALLGVDFCRRLPGTTAVQAALALWCLLLPWELFGPAWPAPPRVDARLYDTRFGPPGLSAAAWHGRIAVDPALRRARFVRAGNQEEGFAGLRRQGLGMVPGAEGWRDIAAYGPLLPRASENLARAAWPDSAPPRPAPLALLGVGWREEREEDGLPRWVNAGPAPRARILEGSLAGLRDDRAWREWTAEPVWIQDGANRVVLGLPPLERRHWLLLSDTWFPGWQAFLDGKAVPIQPVLGGLRGVDLTPGSRRLEFRYRPASLCWGLAILLATALAIWGITAMGARRKRKAATKRRPRRSKSKRTRVDERAA